MYHAFPGPCVGPFLSKKEDKHGCCTVVRRSPAALTSPIRPLPSARRANQFGIAGSACARAQLRGQAHRGRRFPPPPSYPRPPCAIPHPATVACVRARTRLAARRGCVVSSAARGCSAPRRCAGQNEQRKGNETSTDTLRERSFGRRTPKGARWVRDWGRCFFPSLFFSDRFFLGRFRK